MNKKVLYLLMFLVIVAFAVREGGNIYARTYGVSVLPESLKWIEDLDRIVFFFSDRGGDVYSIINWTFILGAFLVVGMLRTLRKIEPPNLTDFHSKIVDEKENPFSMVSGWKKEVENK